MDNARRNCILITPGSEKVKYDIDGVWSGFQESGHAYTVSCQMSIVNYYKFVFSHCRIHNYLLFGALQAVVFPVVNTRLVRLRECLTWTS